MQYNNTRIQYNNAVKTTTTNTSNAVFVFRLVTTPGVTDASGLSRTAETHRITHHTEHSVTKQSRSSRNWLRLPTKLGIWPATSAATSAVPWLCFTPINRHITDNRSVVLTAQSRGVACLLTLLQPNCIWKFYDYLLLYWFTCWCEFLNLEWQLGSPSSDAECVSFCSKQRDSADWCNLQKSSAETDRISGNIHCSTYRIFCLTPVTKYANGSPLSCTHSASLFIDVTFQGNKSA